MPHPVAPLPPDGRDHAAAGWTAAAEKLAALVG
jgi:hypothetical protein